MAQGTDTDLEDHGSRGPFTPPTLEVIARLFPQLEILNLLGAGGMGAVYKVRQPALDRFAALKVLPAGGAEGASFAERFSREARALARLNHPNIVAVYEFGHVEGLHFFLMEYVDGANLRQLVQGGRIAPREALQLIPQVCDALQYAHDEGVVHRDIKPENMLVDRKGRVKIADFGLAKILGSTIESCRLTGEGQVMGTPHYMAPEQVARPLSVDHRADIYSLGVVLYEMLTGDLPIGKFPPPSSSPRAVQVDVRFDDVVLRALENDPERRYQKVSEVKSRVETITGSPIAAAVGANEEPTVPPPAMSGRKYLYWGPFPVVVQYDDDEREISWNGGLAALAVAFFCLFLGDLLVRVVMRQHMPGIAIPLAATLLIVFWGIRRTLNLPRDHELPRTPQGTVIFPPRRWWQSVWIPFAAIPLIALAWSFIQIRWDLSLEFIRNKGGSEASASKPGATVPPELRFLAWQDEWQTNTPPRAWYQDGTKVVNRSDVALMRAVKPVVQTMNKESAATGKASFLHLWISQEQFDRNSAVSVSITDTNGQPLKLGLGGSMAGRIQVSTNHANEPGWFLLTFSPGELHELPPRINIRMDYAVGPVTGPGVSPDFKGMMSLADGSQLNGIGQDVTGKAFVSLTIDSKGTQRRQLVVSAKTRKGRYLEPTGGGKGQNVGAGVRAETFHFDAPLAQIAEFRVGTRLLRTAEWRDVPLLGKGFTR